MRKDPNMGLKKEVVEKNILSRRRMCLVKKELKIIKRFGKEKNNKIKRENRVF